MSTDDLSAVVLFEARDDADLRAIASALRRELGDDEHEAQSDDASTAGPIALPVADERAPRLDDARVVVALDERSVERAREAGVPRVIALAPRFALPSEELDVDLVLVTHEALVHEAIARGVPATRVRSIGPIAPEGWAPVADGDALRATLGPRADARWVVVRAAALEDDPAPALVQLSLVSADVVWLFDVGRDPELARALRKRVPAYGLDALMFADGPDARACYQAAHLVLGRIDGPEAIRAVAVGAALAALPASHDQLRVAHALESAGFVEVADAAATLAVTIDRALEPEALRRARAAASDLHAEEGARRAAGVIRELARGELDAGMASGLPVGLERLSHPDDESRGPERAPAPKKDELDAQVDEELAALRRKLGL